MTMKRAPLDFSAKVLAGTAASAGVSLLSWLVIYLQGLLPLLPGEPLLLLLVNIAILVANFAAGYLKGETAPVRE